MGSDVAVSLRCGKSCVLMFFIAFAHTGKNIAVQFMQSAEGLVMYSMHSLLMHISCALSIVIL